MVEDTREKAGLSAIQPIGLPTSIDVKVDSSGFPLEVRVGHLWLAAQVVDRWRIEDEWWRRDQVSRAYFSLLLEDERPLTLFRDLVTGKWFRQHCC